ncbi:MAG: RCC1 domain-containing protein, partial [bacterium]
MINKQFSNDYKESHVWKWYISGYVGDFRSLNRSVPTQIGSNGEWKASGIAFRYNFDPDPSSAVAIKSDGTLWSWGNNERGELGLGDTMYRSSPVQVGSHNNWVKINQLGFAYFAINNNKELYGFGGGSYGILGQGDRENYSSPVLIGSDVEDIKTKSSSSLFFKKTNGETWVCGNNNNGQLGVGNTEDTNSPVLLSSDINWNKFYSSGSYSYHIKEDGTLWSWGSNSGGQLGLGDTINRSSPVQVGTDADWDFVNPYIVAMIKTNGTLWVCGRNNFRKLGTGDNIDRSIPTQIGTDANWIEAYNLGQSSIFVKSDSTLWGTGKNNYGELGLSDTIIRSKPTLIGSNFDIDYLFSGTNCFFAKKNDGNFYAWGASSVGSLGVGNVSINSSSPTLIGSNIDFDYIENSSATSYGTTLNGNLYGWGRNERGDLGLGYSGYINNFDKQINLIVPSINNNKRGILRFFIKYDGTLWARGDNNYGQLGIPEIENAIYSPIQVGTDTDWFLANGGLYHSIALKNNGTLWVWGYNNNGQLGLGDTSDRSSPVQLGTDNNWINIYANSYTTMA